MRQLRQLHLPSSSLVRFGSMKFSSVDASLQVGHERIEPDPANFANEYGLDIFDLDPILDCAARHPDKLRRALGGGKLLFALVFRERQILLQQLLPGVSVNF